MMNAKWATPVVVTILLGATGLGAQELPVTVEAEYGEGFGLLTAVRELPDGRVLVADPLGQLLAALDLTQAQSSARVSIRLSKALADLGSEGYRLSVKPSRIDLAAAEPGPPGAAPRAASNSPIAPSTTSSRPGPPARNRSCSRPAAQLSRLTDGLPVAAMWNAGSM